MEPVASAPAVGGFADLEVVVVLGEAAVEHFAVELVAVGGPHVGVSVGKYADVEKVDVEEADIGEVELG